MGRYTPDMARAMVMAAMLAASAAAVAAQGRGAPPAATPAPKIATAAACAADLGSGAASRRSFCDILIVAKPAGSIAVTIPPHTGTARLKFDLHNRFTIPAAGVAVAEAFARHSAQIAVIGADGAIIDRAVVTREFRTVEDLFDQLRGGGRPGGVKGIGPGQPIAVEVALPAGLGVAGIVGVRLEQFTLGANEVYDAPGRAIAIASNIRLEYLPR
jgi:hypothetical protein